LLDLFARSARGSLLAAAIRLRRFRSDVDENQQEPSCSVRRYLHGVEGNRKEGFLLFKYLVYSMIRFYWLKSKSLISPIFEDILGRDTFRLGSLAWRGERDEESAE
jgi:hypothetical protein